MEFLKTEKTHAFELRLRTVKFASLPISSGSVTNLFFRKSKTDNLQQLPICNKNSVKNKNAFSKVVEADKYC